MRAIAGKTMALRGNRPEARGFDRLLEAKGPQIRWAVVFIYYIFACQCFGVYFFEVAMALTLTLSDCSKPRQTNRAPSMPRITSHSRSLARGSLGGDIKVVWGLGLGGVAHQPRRGHPRGDWLWGRHREDTARAPVRGNGGNGSRAHGLSSKTGSWWGGTATL